MFRILRIAILLTVLVVVGGRQLLTEDRLSSWDKPLWVTVYPVLVEPGAELEQFAASLSADSFREVGDFLKRQASRHGRSIAAPVIQVARPLTEVPPPLPAQNSGLRVAFWSLKMRWWSWKNTGQDNLAPDDVRIFVLYQRNAVNGLLDRSVGVRNAGYGIVNAIASRPQAARNRLVIAHELLHVLGASDRYDLETGQPRAPEGLADPDQSPRYPQSHCEIMAGRIAVSSTRWRRAASLNSCVIGALTASEIGW